MDKLKEITSILVGAFFMIIGILMLVFIIVGEQTIIPGLIFFFGGLYFLPQSKSSLKDKFNISLKPLHQALYGMVVFILGFISFGFAIGASNERSVNVNNKKEIVVTIPTKESFKPSPPSNKVQEKKKNHAQDRIKIIEQNYQLGFKAQGNSNLEEAKKKYEIVLKYDPKYKDANKRLLAVNRQIKEAEERLKKKKEEEKRQAAAAHAEKAKREELKWTNALTDFRKTVSKFKDIVESSVYEHDTYIGREIHKDSKKPWIRITVSNAWQYEPKQIRMQAGENLWKLWLRSAIKYDLVENADKARIKLVDYNNNEVGGSRVWGGSLIWVND